MREIYWGAFAGAAILTSLVPAVPALLILWILVKVQAGAIIIIPAAAIAAAGMGAPTYLLFGLPAFALAIRRTGVEHCWAAGLVANLVSAPFVLVFLILFSREPWGGTAFLVGFGCIFAPLWGAIFRWLYGAFTRQDRT